MCEYIGDFASGIYEDLGNPSGITSTYISGWLVSDSNIGRLNILINTSYSGVSGCVFGPDGEPLGPEEMAIYQEMFNIKYYERLVSFSLNAAGYDSWIEIADEGSRIKRLGKNDLAKSYSSSRAESQRALSLLAAQYRNNLSTPKQVVGDDMIDSTYDTYLGNMDDTSR